MTREEIIQGLQFTIDMFLLDPNTGETFTEPRNDMDKTTVDACRGAIELLEQEPRWIPVSERLPESNGMYLVSELVYSLNKPRGYGYEPIENKVDFVEFSTIDGWRRAKQLYEVIAWMPLPEPYKEK